MASLLAPQSIFDPPPLLHTLLTQPLKTILRLLHAAFSLLRSKPAPATSPIRVVCISDTHTLKVSLPDGDLLIHAGDLANAGTPREIQAQIDWLDAQPHLHKIVIAGNHDTWLDPRSRETLRAADSQQSLDWKGVVYLQHAATTLHFPRDAGQGRTLKVFGAPQIPACGGQEFAFQYVRGVDAWSNTVPDDVDVLVTHTPPKYHLDLPAALGCEHLLAECWRTRPRLHVFGHVHAGKTEFFGGSVNGGEEVVRWDAQSKALEVGLRRKDGLMRGLLDLRGYIDIGRLVWHGCGGLLWDRLWGGECKCTTMVNAALMYNSSGELRNSPTVVEI